MTQLEATDGDGYRHYHAERSYFRVGTYRDC